MPSPRFDRVFVVGAYLPNGGTFMAYHLGRLLQRDFGVTAYGVTIADEKIDNGIHAYDVRMPNVSIAEMEKQVSDRDILIVNPSFSSHQFGWRLPGFKICYVQGFTTFTLLDGNFDCYVAVSDFVQHFLKTVYALDVEVIPPFIAADTFPSAPDWHERSATDVLCYGKGDANIVTLSLDRLRERMKASAPHVTISEPLPAHGIAQRDLLAAIGKSRHFLTLSAGEGFGLVPLEAMALGTTVVGFDGFGGRHYMRSGHNCAVAAYPHIDRVADLLLDVIERPHYAAQLADAGRMTASEYSYERFRQRWIDRFARTLGIAPLSR
jgi:glycosyltransferase involved in cell wall biosynthesis